MYYSPRYDVLLDANVLYPPLLRDVLLSFAEAKLYRVHWSDKINSEWSSKVIKKAPKLKSQIKRTIKIMNEAFPDANITGYENLISADGMDEMPDKKDKHVLAAAVRCNAGVIVTYDLDHFPNEVLAPFRIYAQSPDEFLSFAVDLQPAKTLAVLEDMLADYDDPPISLEEAFVSLETKFGLKETVKLLRNENKLES